LFLYPFLLLLFPRIVYFLLLRQKKVTKKRRFFANSSAGNKGFAAWGVYVFFRLCAGFLSCGCCYGAASCFILLTSIFFSALLTDKKRRVLGLGCCAFISVLCFLLKIVVQLQTAVMYNHQSQTGGSRLCRM